MIEGTTPTPRLVPPGAAFEEFKTYVQNFDPLDLLCQLTMTFLFNPEGFQGEATDTRRWARWIEFTAGYLATIATRSGPYEIFDGAHIEEFERLILQYFNSFLYDFVNKAPDAPQRTPSERVQQTARNYSLWVRGDAYPHQLLEYSLELYGEHDDWFRGNLGFTIQEAARIFRAVTDELNRRFNESANNARANAPAESVKYWEGAKAAGLTRDGFCWLFTNPMVPSVLFHTFFFDLMSDRSYSPRFEKARGKFVERKVQEYMSRVFPKDMIFMNPDYPDGNEFSDVAVLHDGKILIFQCKAKGLTRDARIGADFSRLRADMQAAIRSAFDQAVRARRYIRSTNTPTLKVGPVQLQIDGSAITDIYLINVTLMPFLIFATRFENIEEALGLFPEKEYPFSTSLGDLDIITQVLSSPATFLHYVERRLAVEKTSFGVDADEMDLLGFYVSQGMYFSTAEFSDITDLYLRGFSDEIDEYVYRKHDAHEDVKAPAAPVPEGFPELIAEVEGLSNLHRTDAAVGLLDMSGASRKKFLEMIEKAKDSTSRDHSGHSVSMGSQEHSRGFSFITVVGEKRDEAVFEQAMSFALLKKYSEKYNEWFGFGWRKDSSRIIDAAVSLKFVWEEDEQMKDFASRFLKPGKRIDLRNEA
jgi:hypothetical protein